AVGADDGERDGVVARERELHRRVLHVGVGEGEALHRGRPGRGEEQLVAGAAFDLPAPRRRGLQEEQLALDIERGEGRDRLDARIARRRAVEHRVAAQGVVGAAVAIVVEVVALLARRADGADARTPAAELDAGAGGGAVGAAADAALAGRTLEAFLDGAGA